MAINLSETKTYGPTARPDSQPPHANLVRRFREELRLTRDQFADLVGTKVATLRVWEENRAYPRGQIALKILALAKRNQYPLSIEEIFPRIQPKMKKSDEKQRGNISP